MYGHLGRSANRVRAHRGPCSSVGQCQTHSTLLEKLRKWTLCTVLCDVTGERQSFTWSLWSRLIYCKCLIKLCCPVLQGAHNNQLTVVWSLSPYFHHFLFRFAQNSLVNALHQDLCSRWRSLTRRVELLEQVLAILGNATSSLFLISTCTSLFIQFVHVSSVRGVIR